MAVYEETIRVNVDASGAVRSIEAMGQKFEDAQRAAQGAVRATQAALGNVSRAATAAASAIGSIGRAAQNVTRSVAGLGKSIVNVAASVTAVTVGGIFGFGIASFKAAARVETLNQ